MTTTLELDFNEWVHPTTKQVRRYVNNWTDICGLEVDYYKSGNVSSAALNGEHIPNVRAVAIMCAKVWLDEADQVHVDYLSRRAADYLTRDEIVEAIGKHYKESKEQ